MNPIVAVFAHPDDEVFGPGGTLAKFARERETYIICITDGDAGINSSGQTRALGEIRKEELLASAKALGIQKVFFLGYHDGTLSNNLYHEIAEKIKTYIKKLDPELLITFEPRGVSGHLDHIAVSMITTYVFQQTPTIQELWYYCLTEKARALHKDYYIYFPPGYKDSEISRVEDVTDVWEQKITAMHKHQSQRHDLEKLLGTFMKRSKEEYFIIKKRP